MIPYLLKTPGWLMKWLPSMTWVKNTDHKEIYLTFDDGPIPNVTPYVLETLEQYGAKATFFCVGENVKKHRDVFLDVLDAGHATGNHTYHHLNGWHTRTSTYWEDVIRCESTMNDHGAISNLFRPPYGRMRKEQRLLVEEKYQIIMWSHLSGDFDQGLDQKKSMNSMKKARKGSILVFHDSFKAERNLRSLLPDMMKYFSDQDYEFKSL